MPDYRQEVDAYLERVRRAAGVQLGIDLSVIASQLRLDLATAAGAPGAVLAARRRAAQLLRELRPVVAETLRRMLAEGVALGADGASGLGPGGGAALRDPVIKKVLARVNTPIRRHARLSAGAVMRLPLSTPAQVQVVMSRIDAVMSEVDSAALIVATRAVDVGLAAASSGLRIWVTRPGCCLVCAGFAGATAGPGQAFAPRANYADRAGSAWGDLTLTGPPAHPWCRCLCIPGTLAMADRIARRAARDVASGNVYASMPEKARAAGRLSAIAARAAQRVRGRTRRSSAA